ncbi:MAG: uroporphyrinogen-III C-methyltransferase [Planctomycetota bacterium]
MTWRSGSVYLVGAGPGDPGLITRRGHELLRAATVVVHDRLVGDGLLAEIPPDAERIDASKAPHDHTLTQEQINAVLVERALAGEIVVRLKGGDPFVFGRGSEEAEACRRAGVPCEIVPGVTSAIAGPASVGIPVTARGLARGCAIITARTGASAAFDTHDWSAFAQMDALVVLMGRAELAEVCDELIRAGRAPDTPAAIVERATLPGERSVRGTLATLPDRADRAEIESPAVVVIGEVAAIGESRGPLAGVRVVVTRPRSASAELHACVRALGADVIDCPMIEIRDAIPDPARLRRALEPAPSWVVATSRHGAAAFARSLRAARLDARALAGARLAAVGPTTQAAFEAAGLMVDLVPGVHRASGLIEAMARSGPPGRVLFAAGTLARDELADGLRGCGFEIDVVTVYETTFIHPTEHARREIERGVDAVLLASPSAARSWAEAGLPTEGPRFVAIGPTTAQGAAACGIACAATAESHSDAGLVETLIAMRSREAAA